MTNGEKFLTADERLAAFMKFCEGYTQCDKCELLKYAEIGACKFAWLDLEYKEELKPCPFCNSETRVADNLFEGKVYWRIECTKCFSRTIGYLSKHEAITAWNRRV